MEKFKAAMDEMQAIRTILERRQQHALRIRNWLYALLAVVLFGAFLGYSPRNAPFQLMTALLACGLGVWLAYQNTITHFAVERLQDIEYHVRNDISHYDGARFSESLADEPRSRRNRVFAQQAFRPHIWLPVGVALACVIVGMASARNGEASGRSSVSSKPSAEIAQSASVTSGAYPRSQALSESVSCTSSPPKKECPAVASAASAPSAPRFDSTPLLRAVTGTVVIGALGILGGAALLLFGRGSVAKVMGVLSLLAGAGLQFHLIKDLKIEKLFELGFSPKVELVVNNKIAAVDFLPQLLGTVRGFASGEDAIREAKQAPAVAEICGRWRLLAESGKGLLVIIGSTDRVPLRGDKRRRFDANVGLARARGEAVKSRLLKKCDPMDDYARAQLDHAIVLVSGPETTPPFAAGMPADNTHGFESDRKVDVYLLSVGVAANAASNALLQQ